MTEIKPGYLRVSEVIAPFTGIEFIPDEPLRKAGDRGTMVHDYIESTLRGHQWEVIPPEIKPYYEAWRSFFFNEEFIENGRFEKGGELIIERRFYDDELMITGQCDLIYIPSGDFPLTVLYDWKTSAFPSKGWALQAAAYMYLSALNGIFIHSAKFVHLKKDGTYKVYEFYPSKDSEIFSDCLRLYRYFDMANTRKRRL